MQGKVYQLHPYLKVNGNGMDLKKPRNFIYEKKWENLRKLKDIIEKHPELGHLSKKKVFRMIDQALRRHMKEAERHSILIEGAIPKEDILESVAEVFNEKVLKFRQGQVPNAFDLGSFVEAHLQNNWINLVREYNGDASVIIRGKGGAYTGLSRSWTLTEHLFYAFSHPYLQETKEDKVALAFLRFIYGQLFHPFIDGNGRAGRSLLNSELIALGLPPLVITMKNREEYLDRLEEISIEFGADIRSYWRDVIENLKYWDERWRVSVILTLVLEHSPKSIKEFINWSLDRLREEGEIMIAAHV